MLASVVKVLHKTHRKCGVNKDMEGWMKRGKSWTLTLCWWWWQGWKQWWMTGIIGRHDFFQLSNNASRIPFVLAVFPKGEDWRKWKNNSSSEPCHVREAREMTGQRVLRKIKVPMTTVDRRWRRSELPWYVGHLPVKGKLRRIGCCERKDKYVEQKLWRKYEERIRIAQNGWGCSHGRKTRRKRKRYDQRIT